MLQISLFERKTTRAHERGSVSGDCTCIYHNCSFAGAEKPMSGANPACQVSIAHLRRFRNCNFGPFRLQNQHYRLRLSRKQAHNREERVFPMWAARRKLSNECELTM